MSGPTTASYSLVSAEQAAQMTAALGAAQGVWLAAQILREARQMGREYAEIEADSKLRAAKREQERQAQLQSRLGLLTTLRASARKQETRLARLRSLAATLADRVQATEDRPQDSLAPPADTASEAEEERWREYLAALEAEILRLENHLAEAGKQLSAAGDIALPDFASPDLADVLIAYGRQRALNARLRPDLVEAFKATAARILDRLELAPGESVPQELDALARAIVLADSVERAEALASELRLGVQRHLEAAATQQRDSAEAVQLLNQLSGPLAEVLDASLRRDLERIAIGAQPFDTTTRAAADTLKRELAAERKRQEEAAAAWVLEQSLRDLGYDVEAVEQTLFVDGGVVHFQRHGWEGYYVRLRLNAEEKTANFNIVRAKDGDTSAERKRLDYLAEDRWCSEFPKLLETLKARGIQLNVTRLLGAGELPVQNVDPASLPTFEHDESRREAAVLKQMGNG